MRTSDMIARFARRYSGQFLLLFRRTPDATSIRIPVASSFFDRRLIPLLSPISEDMSLFHPDLKTLLDGCGGIRKWEYGMLVLGLPPLTGMELLDIGAGPSLLPAYMARRLGARVTVVDLPDPYTIDGATLPGRLSRLGVRFRSGDMRCLPFPDATFDAVTSISAIEHLSHNADHSRTLSVTDFVRESRQALAEMYRVLRPGGWLYVTSETYLPGRIDNDAWISGWGGSFIDGNPYGAYPVDRVDDVFIGTLRELGAWFPYPTCYDANLLVQNDNHATYRHRFVSAFNLFARKPIA